MAYANFPVNNPIVTIVIPPVLNIKTFKPDTYNVVICGDFDSIKNVKAKLIWDKSNVLDISLTDNEFKKGDKNYYSDINSPFFTQPKTLGLDVEKLQTIETIVEFDGIKSGVAENFTRKSSYVINRHVLYLNDLIFLLLGKIFVP